MRSEGRKADDGHIMMLGMVAAALLIGAGLLLQLTQVMAGRTAVQTAADAAALAAGQAVRDAVSGTDSARWDCAGAREGPARAAAARYADRNGAALVDVRRDGCDIEVTVARPLPPPGAIHAVRASARARVLPGAKPGTGPVSRVAVPAAPIREGTLLEALVAEADRIDRLDLPYVWGGGHQSSPAPPDGPFDCSGAVSRVLQAAGYPIRTMVSREFMSIGSPGPGRVTIWAYDGHVFMTINGRGWGTGSAPRGGAGWLPYHSPYHSRFVARHIPEFEDDTIQDISDIGLGTIWLPEGVGTPPRVVLAGQGT